ncbi:uncharacterized protein F4807DRAFT_457584 [Annulohypoxylon truncatum]|uniref:uncharacterized protein n=1 Tax=Annulohypoxylon truncatum TaxID=327061 RepID=UPI002007AF80|nr:uncharacterized protein F4807DRAFT_457584 [Annulohypoxylon truncatum]KAI1212786.1 hypothetical protein F4807DRAFT_457584 [Annulohypoxylon truncatum]
MSRKELLRRNEPGGPSMPGITRALAVTGLYRHRHSVTDDAHPHRFFPANITSIGHEVRGDSHPTRSAMHDASESPIPTHSPEEKTSTRARSGRSQMGDWKVSACFFRDLVVASSHVRILDKQNNTINPGGKKNRRLLPLCVIPIPTSTCQSRDESPFLSLFLPPSPPPHLPIHEDEDLDVGLRATVTLVVIRKTKANLASRS